MADQPGIFPDLARLLMAARAGRHDAFAYADRITSRLGLGEDVTDSAAEAALRTALGPALDREQLGTVLAALEDAADYRREYQDGYCADCGPAPGGDLCGDHASDEVMAAMYDMLHGELQERQGCRSCSLGDGGGGYPCDCPAACGARYCQHPAEARDAAAAAGERRDA